MRNDLNNPQAFPGLSEGDFPGMTLRDYFAGQIVAGGAGSFYNFVRTDNDYEEVAKIAYKLADAMLAERMKP